MSTTCPGPGRKATRSRSKILLPTGPARNSSAVQNRYQAAGNGANRSAGGAVTCSAVFDGAGMIGLVVSSSTNSAISGLPDAGTMAENEAAPGAIIGHSSHRHWLLRLPGDAS